MSRLAIERLEKAWFAYKK
ncbi:hypothetical protein Gotri_012411 [Gossypium trilobum]|uniref:Uncharacterized protein n=1 Tax=Gossypium trilobum TaxID=34281 RepID=A0A7J9DQD8_9ROSI|nr:hypothetical protein [Gossypium trilobum]